MTDPQGWRHRAQLTASKVTVKEPHLAVRRRTRPHLDAHQLCSTDRGNSFYLQLKKPWRPMWLSSPFCRQWKRGTERWNNLDLRSYSSERWSPISNASVCLQGLHCPFLPQPCPCLWHTFCSLTLPGVSESTPTQGTWHTDIAVVIVSWSKWTTNGTFCEWIIFVDVKNIVSICSIYWCVWKVLIR